MKPSFRCNFFENSNRQKQFASLKFPWLNFKKEAKLANFPEIYVSTDIETDGRDPGNNSMLSIGSAAYFADKTLISTFSANLETLPDAIGDSETMKWWGTQPEAWAACRKDCVSPVVAMKDYLEWLEQLPGRIIFVAYPLAFDYPFVTYYLRKFTDKNPFGFSAIDIRSYIMGLRGKDYRHSGIEYLPKRFFDDLPHTHVALDDALEQGALFCNLLAEQGFEKS
jgi:DNA polymerase III alpha subunit (gram-positive type)